jgi:hypothetical protein
MNKFTFNCYTDRTISYAISRRLINAENWFIPREVYKGFVVERMALEEDLVSASGIMPLVVGIYSTFNIHGSVHPSMT